MFTIDFSNLPEYGNFSMLHHYAGDELERILEFISESEAILIEKAKKKRDEYEKDQKEAGDDEQKWEDIYFEHKDEMDNRLMYFPQLFYSSSFLMVHNFFEDYMKEIDKQFVQEFKPTTPFASPTQDIINKYKNHILLISGINFSPMTAQWNRILEFRTFRNFTVHFNSNISAIPPGDRMLAPIQQITGNSIFKIIDGEKVMMRGSGFILEYSSLIKEVVEFLFTEGAKILKAKNAV